MNKHNLISVIIPVISVLLIASVYFIMEPETTGLVVNEANQSNRLVDADVILSTKVNEVIPPNAIVEITLDNNKGEMTISDFIKRTGKEYKIENGELPDFGFYGAGFTGNFVYNLSLSEFNINRNIGVGQHVFITRIKYRGNVLYSIHRVSEIPSMK